MGKSYRVTMVEARRAYADGVTDSVALARQFKVSPKQIEIWKQIYDFVGYTNRRESLRADSAIAEALGGQDQLTTVIDLLKNQLVFAVKEGDIIFSNVQEVKTFIETIHMIEGKPTVITKEIQEDLNKKDISELTGDEAMDIAARIVAQA